MIEINNSSYSLDDVRLLNQWRVLAITSLVRQNSLVFTELPEPIFEPIRDELHQMNVSTNAIPANITIKSIDTSPNSGGEIEQFSFDDFQVYDEYNYEGGIDYEDSWLEYCKF